MAELGVLFMGQGVPRLLRQYYTTVFRIESRQYDAPTEYGETPATGDAPPFSTGLNI